MSAKLIRLLNLLAFLLDQPGPVTKRTIRQTLTEYRDLNPDSFNRQFERDKNQLRDLGMPLHLQDVFLQGEWVAAYSLDPEQYGSLDPQLTDTERAALLLAVQNARWGANSAVYSAFFKLGGLPPAAALDPVDIDEPNQTATLALSLMKAAHDRRLVSFCYADDSVPRSVEPHGVALQRGRWYLAAGTKDGQPRSFRLDRMSDLEVGAEANQFEPNPELSPTHTLSNQPWEIGSEEPVLARVRFQPEVAWWVARRLKHKPVEGEWEVELAVTNTTGLFRWLIGMGKFAQLLSPADLVDRFIAHIEAGFIQTS